MCITIENLFRNAPLVQFLFSLWGRKSKKMTPLQKKYEDYKMMVLIPFRNGVDNYIRSPKQFGPNVFGKLIWQLILPCEPTQNIIENVIDYFKDNVINAGIIYDQDDYHLHLAFLYLKMGQLNKSLNELEKIQTASLNTELQKWATTKALLAKGLSNYPPTNLINGLRTYSPLSMANDEIKMIYSWQISTTYWNDIGKTDTAYFECLNTLQYTAKVFESRLNDLCNRKRATPLKHDINAMIVALQNNYSGMASIKANMEQISLAKTPHDLRTNLNAFEQRIQSYTQINEKYGGILFLCRVIRNNSSHESSLTNHLFQAPNEYIKLISILHEGILMVNQM